MHIGEYNTVYFFLSKTAIILYQTYHVKDLYCSGIEHRT